MPPRLEVERTVETKRTRRHQRSAESAQRSTRGVVDAAPCAISGPLSRCTRTGPRSSSCRVRGRIAEVGSRARRESGAMRAEHRQCATCRARTCACPRLLLREAYERLRPRLAAGVEPVGDSVAASASSSRGAPCVNVASPDAGCYFAGERRCAGGIARPLLARGRSSDGEFFVEIARKLRCRWNDVRENFCVKCVNWSSCSPKPIGCSASEVLETSPSGIELPSRMSAGLSSSTSARAREIRGLHHRVGGIRKRTARRRGGSAHLDRAALRRERSARAPERREQRGGDPRVGHEPHADLRGRGRSAAPCFAPAPM